MLSLVLSLEVNTVLSANFAFAISIGEFLMRGALGFVLGLTKKIILCSDLRQLGVALRDDLKTGLE